MPASQRAASSLRLRFALSSEHVWADSQSYHDSSPPRSPRLELLLLVSTLPTSPVSTLFSFNLWLQFDVISDREASVSRLSHLFPPTCPQRSRSLQHSYLHRGLRTLLFYRPNAPNASQRLTFAPSAPFSFPHLDPTPAYPPVHRSILSFHSTLLSSTHTGKLPR